MNRILLILLLMLCQPVFAQTQPTGDGEPVVQTETLTEAAQDPEDLSENPEAKDDETALPDEPEAASSDDLANEILANEAVEAAAQAGPVEDDFDPDEEISEDFPISLPSDI